MSFLCHTEFCTKRRLDTYHRAELDWIGKAVSTVFDVKLCNATLIHTFLMTTGEYLFYPPTYALTIRHLPSRCDARKAPRCTDDILCRESSLIPGGYGKLPEFEMKSTAQTLY